MTVEAPPQNEDGRPHFTYFRLDFNISFVWSGIAGEPIEVCPNGYGEPAIHKIETPFDTEDERANAETWVKWFKTRCDVWIHDNLHVTDAQISDFMDKEDDDRP